MIIIFPHTSFLGNSFEQRIDMEQQSKSNVNTKPYKSYEYEDLIKKDGNRGINHILIYYLVSFQNKENSMG